MKKTLQSIILIALSCASYYLIMMLIFSFILPVLPKSLTSDYGFSDTFGCCFLLIIYVIWYWYLRRKQLNTNGLQMSLWPAKNVWNKSTLLFVIALGMGGLANTWLLLVDKYLSKISFIGKSYSNMQNAFSSMESGAMLFSFFSIVIVGPIVEELLFRGILYKYLERLSKNKWIPIIGTAILFGIWHGMFVQGVYAAMCGFIMALVVYQTKDLRYSIVIHILNNFFSYIASVPKLENIGFAANIICFVMIIPMIFILYTKGQPITYMKTKLSK